MSLGERWAFIEVREDIVSTDDRRFGERRISRYQITLDELTFLLNACERMPLELGHDQNMNLLDALREARSNMMHSPARSARGQ